MEVSAALTGFSRVELLGTGMCERYLAELDDIVTAATVDDFLATDDPSARMSDDAWSPLAHNLVVLWYCGTWSPLPDSWTANHPTGGKDTDHVVSAEAYQAGLQWVAAGAHPMAARQQGFGAWSVAPEDAS